MSETGQDGLIRECTDLWNEIDEQLERALNDLVLTTNGEDLITKLKEQCCKEDVWNGELLKNSLKKGLEKLKRKNENFNKLNQLQFQLSTDQQSGASSIALASTLGPVAGIGAGLSLFPLQRQLKIEQMVI